MSSIDTQLINGGHVGIGRVVVPWCVVGVEEMAMRGGKDWELYRREWKGRQSNRTGGARDEELGCRGGDVQDPSPPEDLVPSSLNPLPVSDTTTAPTSVVHPSSSVNKTSPDNRGGRGKRKRRNDVMGNCR
ncbi:hypothetical protein LZ31DRAFT_182384 [Colletotrichum somersetense]|nr:hypothetical protein LZ31DRAFT_182384 [Colletotrichum somersetense]